MAVEDGRPEAGVDYPRTYADLLEWFADDAACLEYLGRLRWPEGFRCPACGAGEYWRTGTGLWMCVACGRRTSVTAGTVLHRTRTPLTTWFAAVWFVTSTKTGVSAQGLQRVLGFGSYETAWAWLHKLRRAMVRPDRDLLGGPGVLVELDETFLDGVTRGGVDLWKAKVPVMLAVEKRGRKLGRIRARVTARPGSLAILDFAAEVIAPGTTVRTDGAPLLRRLADLGYAHQPTVAIRATDPATVLPGLHTVASLLKRWLIATLHYGIAAEHLPYYLDEFTFRFNRRDSRSRGLLFYRLLQQAIATDPHPLDTLIGGTQNTNP
ncbi:IS1595 family transposase [Actinotalea subterranea]|uniref:IS1595 family transposase n=1 Tax=Actinotalea subterranea TaxID=2607497 RepID=UPI0011EC9B90|nr:IS1595 family transposase [Actinotalea subterranea]